MKKAISLFLLVASLFACNTSPEAKKESKEAITVNAPYENSQNCQGNLTKLWKAFRDHENDETFNAIYNCLPEEEVPSGDSTLITIEFSTLVVEDFPVIEQKIAEGNKYYSEIAFKLYSFFGAAYAEELDMMLGQLIKVDPLLFLEGVKKNKDLVSIPHISGNFGPDIYEDSVKSALETKERIESLNKVHREDLEEIKKESINALKNNGY